MQNAIAVWLRRLPPSFLGRILLGEDSDKEPLRRQCMKLWEEAECVVENSVSWRCQMWNIYRGKLQAINKPAQERGHVGFNWQGHRDMTAGTVWNSNLSTMYSRFWTQSYKS